MAKSYRKSPLSVYKNRVGRPDTLDELLDLVEYLYPRVHGFLSPRKYKGHPLLPFERAEIEQAVKAVPRLTMEEPSRWATRIVARMISQPEPKPTGGMIIKSHGYYRRIRGGRVRNMLTEINARKAKPFATRSNTYELVSQWIRNGDVEVPIDVTV